MNGSEERLSVELKTQVELDYLLYLPESGSTGEGPAPLLLFLHGAGERGNDLSLVKQHGPPRIIEEGRELPFIVAAPQCPEGVWWKTDPIMALLDNLLEQHKVDKSRIYLTGLSMGGYGTWMAATEYPDRFAAVAPICGPLVRILPSRFKNLPVWCFHGALDPVVPVQESIRMVRQVRHAGGDIRLTVYSEAGHDSWTEAYAGDALYDWFLMHRRSYASSDEPSVDEQL
jgi:predicted peptidase